MENLKNITEFVVVANLENRALNAGINKAQNWWKDRHNQNQSNSNNNNNNEPARASGANPVPLFGFHGQFLVTVLCAENLPESRLSMLTSTVASSSSSSDRPFVILECNQQRFQTTQADSGSTNRNPHWTSGNGPFGFNVFNPDADRLTVWIQQQRTSLGVIAHKEPKLIGMCEANVRQLIQHQQIWLPLRKDNRPAGQVLLQIAVNSDDKPPMSFNRVL